MFNEYPYTDSSIMNMDYILSEIAKMKKAQGEFIATNSIKYGDVWDINTTYEKWTIVESGGVAYISKDIVPAGISINNTDYWELVFDGTALIGTMTYSDNGAGRPDENTMNLTSDGVFSPKTATASTKGIVQTGNTMDINDGVIDVKTATASTKGIVQTGNTMEINDGVIDVKTATASTKGIVQTGNTMEINDGVIDVKTATASTKGIVQTGNTMDINDGVIDVKTATASSLGIVQPDDISITINSSGVISAVSTLPVTIPTMTSAVNGIGRPDNSTVTVDSDGIFSASTMTSSTNGIGRPDNSTVTVDSDGIFSASTMTSSTNGIGRPDNSTITVDNNGIFRALNYYSNKNLIDNPWFSINQRSDTALSNLTFDGQYHIDRWQTNSNLTQSWSWNKNSIYINCNVGTGFGQIVQQFETFPLVEGQTFTLSVLYGDKTIQSITSIYSENVSEYYTPTYNNSFAGLYCVPLSNYYTTYFRCNEGSEVTILALKLELGGVSTLALDVAPDYTTELLKCQRYYRRYRSTNTYTVLTHGMCISSTDTYFNLLLPVPMRTIPTLTTSGTLFVYDGTNSTDITTLTVAYNSEIDNINIVATATGFTPNAVSLIQFKTAGSYIELSAEL